MSKTFYGYVKRDLTKDPDWAAVTSKITDDLVDISKERQATRDDIQKQTLATQDILNTYDQGANQTFNSAIQNGSGQAVDYTLQQYKMLKNGDINYRDYLSSLQVQQDDWKNLNKVSKGWNEKYDEYLRRVKDGESSILEQDSAKYIESFGNISDKTFITSKSNGRLYMATVNPDGSINQDPKTMTTVAAVGNILNDKVDKVDVIGEVNRQVQTLGKVITSMGGKDGIATIEDIRKQPDYQKAEEAIVKGILTTDRDKASVLLDYLKGYKTTRDPSKADETTILLVQDGNGLFQPKLTGPQEKSAYAAVKDQLRSQLDYIETAAPPERKQTYRPTADDRDRWAKTKEIANIFQTAVDLASGDEKSRADALNRVKQYTDITNVVKKGNKWIVELNDGTVQTIDSTGDPELDAKSLFTYTVGEDFKRNYGATSPQTAYDAWKKGGNVAGDLASDFGAMEKIGRKTAFDIEGSSGNTVGDEIIKIFSSEVADNVKLAKLKGVIETMDLPKGIGTPESMITKLESLNTLRGVDATFIIDEFNKEMEGLIEQYNAAGAAGGGMAGF